MVIQVFGITYEKDGKIITANTEIWITMTLELVIIAHEPNLLSQYIQNYLQRELKLNVKSFTYIKVIRWLN